MIAVDTSSLVAFFHDESGDDVDALDMALEQKCLVFSPVVLAEILSDHKLLDTVVRIIKAIPVLEIKRGFWERAGLLRANVLKHGYKAKLADSLIAQNCIDSNVALITRDSDYRNFARYSKLKIWG